MSVRGVWSRSLRTRCLVYLPGNVRGCRNLRQQHRSPPATTAARLLTIASSSSPSVVASLVVGGDAVFAGWSGLAGEARRNAVRLIWCVSGWFGRFCSFRLHHAATSAAEMPSIPVSDGRRGDHLTPTPTPDPPPPAWICVPCWALVPGVQVQAAGTPNHTPTG